MDTLRCRLGKNRKLAKQEHRSGFTSQPAQPPFFPFLQICNIRLSLKQTIMYACSNFVKKRGVKFAVLIGFVSFVVS